MNHQTNSLLLPSLIVLFSTSGQTNAQTNDNVSLYELSLMAYVEAKAEQASASNSVIVLANNVLHDSHVVEKLPSKIGSSTIEYLTAESIQERFRRIGKDFPIVEILPMRSQHGLLVVGCAEFRVSVRHRKLVLGVFGGYEVHWRFDCSKGEYVKIKVERWSSLIL